MFIAVILITRLNFYRLSDILKFLIKIIDNLIIEIFRIFISGIIIDKINQIINKDFLILILDFFSVERGL